MGDFGFDDLPETSKELTIQARRLEAALSKFPPKPCDSERRNDIIQCIQVNAEDGGPEGWPLSSPENLVCDVKFYRGLKEDTLFFIFYNQQGTLAQVMAAMALKYKQWSFHNKLRLWFRRINPPKVMTPVFERGNYLYFDSLAWVLKKRDDFIFETRYMDQSDLKKFFPYG